MLTRTVLKQIRQQPVTAQDRQEVDNLLSGHGINARALTIEGNGTVIFEELARIFVVRPSDAVVFRNHFRTVPMAGTKKVDRASIGPACRSSGTARTRRAPAR